jgi:phage-related protein
LREGIDLYRLIFYRDRKGREPVAEYLADLGKRSDKDSRVKYNKIRDYMHALSSYGTTIGAPYVKHIDGDIWELRPLRDRIFFVTWINGSFILLHHFMKKTQKTPAREIEKAKKEVADIKERGGWYEL